MKNPNDDKFTENENVREIYEQVIGDLLRHPVVRKMSRFRHHGRTSCLEHCLAVSRYSFMWARKLGLDSRSAARAGLLHDLYLYDWHHEHPVPGLHGFTHPKTALEHARKHFQINDAEAESILHHMWPLTWRLPHSRLSWLICLVDKYCALGEIFRLPKFRQDIVPSEKT